MLHCKIPRCNWSHDGSKWREAHVLIISNSNFPTEPRPKGQVWIYASLESPFNSDLSKDFKNNINYTATYRHDSLIRISYGEYVLFDASKQTEKAPLLTNYAQKKTKKVAWFVSNCNAQSRRIKYAKDLAQHIRVDVFGQCGKYKCPKDDDECFNMLKVDYKFYLSFENSLCKDYVTEKFFYNALTFNLIPIVMGASIEEVKKVAPPQSFIHVDEFKSPALLAEYLFYLDSNDTAYNEYFEWKKYGEIKIRNSHPECDMCALAHVSSEIKPSWYSNLNRWLIDGCTT